MSHLGDLLSALVDGELDGTELDRANAHLAACSRCQAEATALRLLKNELRALAEPGNRPGLDSFNARLLELASPVSPAPVQARNLRRERGRSTRTRKSGRSRVRKAAPPNAPAGRRRGRYVVWGALSLVVVGIGSAAFGMGGASGGGSQVPKVTPQLVEFDLQHAINAGDGPFTEPTDSPASPAVKTRSKTPVEATTP